MPSVSKTHTFANAEAARAPYVNTDFDALYAFITSSGSVNHTDGSRAFTTIPKLPFAADGIQVKRATGSQQIVAKQQVDEHLRLRANTSASMPSPPSVDTGQFYIIAGWTWETHVGGGVFNLGFTGGGFPNGVATVQVNMGTYYLLDNNTPALYTDTYTKTGCRVVAHINTPTGSNSWFDYFAVGW